MAYDWRDALRRKLPRDLASGFPALPLLCRLFFLQLLEECDAEGRIRVGVAAPAEALAAMMGAHAGERRLLRQYVPALLEGGFLRHEGAHVCLRPVAERTANESNEPRTNETNRERTERTANELDESTTSVAASARNHEGQPSKPAESTPAAVASAPIAENPADFADSVGAVAPAVEPPVAGEGSGGSPAASLSSLPHSPSLTLPPTTPSDREGLAERATPAGTSMADVVGAAVRAATDAVAAALAAKPTDEPPAEAKPPREPKPDVAPPLAGTPAAEALAALEATQILRGIVARPAALAFALTGGAYPAVDVPREIAAADGWLVSNPANAKKNGARFAVNWFAKAQEKARRVADPMASGVRLAPIQAATPDPASLDREAKLAEWQRKYDAIQAAKAAEVAARAAS